MRVGFVGLGMMGSRMVANLLRAGHEVVVHDVSRETARPLEARGARWAASPTEAARGAQFVLTSLPGPREVEAVVLGEQGILQGAAAGTVYIDLSTSSPVLARRIYSELGKRGIRALDAPVSGGPWGAEAGSLIIIVGGDEEAFCSARPVLEVLGESVTYVGASGSGQVAKLVNNMISLCADQVMAEAFSLGVKAGVRPEKLLEVIQGSGYGKGISLSRMLPEVVFRGDFDNARFALSLARKDLGLATELARDYSVPMPLASVAEQGLVEAMNRGLGDKDCSAHFLLQEERAGVAVRSGLSDETLSNGRRPS
jgi:3-hydroxyisobutyrate dehydrogenase